MISRRETLVSLAALAAALGPARTLAQTTGEPPKLVETPMFEPLVKEGKLPAIAKRVPSAPLVVKLEGEKTPGVHGGVLELTAVQAVPVQVDDDRIAILDESDRSAEVGFGRDVADDQAHRAAGEASIGHEGDRDALPPTERGDARRRVEELRHPRGPARTLVTDHDHVPVREDVRRLLE